jgi:GAF domain-containing protein
MLTPQHEMEESMSDEPARAILVAGGRALAHTAGLEASLEVLLRAITEQLDVDTAVIVASGEDGHGGSATDELRIVAAVGLGEPAATGLTEAMRKPQHPIRRTAASPTTTIDVPPTQPGGPALRSHVPLTVTRAGSVVVLGVLALAHQDPLGAASQPILEAAADLAAVAMERERGGGS